MTLIFFPLLELSLCRYEGVRLGLNECVIRRGSVVTGDSIFSVVSEIIRVIIVNAICLECLYAFLEFGQARTRELMRVDKREFE